jgi:hypothetical protein
MRRRRRRLPRILLNAATAVSLGVLRGDGCSLVGSRHGLRSCAAMAIGRRLGPATAPLHGGGDHGPSSPSRRGLAVGASGHAALVRPRGGGRICPSHVHAGALGRVRGRAIRRLGTAMAVGLGGGPVADLPLRLPQILPPPGGLRRLSPLWLRPPRDARPLPGVRRRSPTAVRVARACCRSPGPPSGGGKLEFRPIGAPPLTPAYTVPRSPQPSTPPALLFGRAPSRVSVRVSEAKLVRFCTLQNRWIFRGFLSFSGCHRRPTKGFLNRRSQVRILSRVLGGL